MRCPKCGKPLVCAACAGSVGGAARVAKGFASAEVQAKAQATRKRKARAARDSHNVKVSRDGEGGSMKKRAEAKAEPQAPRRRLDRVVLLDDDGEKVRAGDEVCFSYGIPPVHVTAPIVKRNGRLIALTPGHDPEEIALRNLRKHVGCWYKQNPRAHTPDSGSVSPVVLPLNSHNQSEMK